MGRGARSGARAPAAQEGFPMTYVLPITIALATTLAQKDQAFGRLAALLEQPMVRSQAQSRGIPFMRLQHAPPYAHEEMFAASFWFFLECANEAAASGATAAAVDLLGSTELQSIAKMNGVLLASISVGEPTAYRAA